MRKTWTDAEINYISENAGRLTDIEISIELTRIMGRPVGIYAVREQRYKLNIAKKHGRGYCKIEQRNQYRGLCLMITGSNK